MHSSRAANKTETVAIVACPSLNKKNRPRRYTVFGEVRHRCLSSAYVRRHLVVQIHARGRVGRTLGKVPKRQQRKRQPPRRRRGGAQRPVPAAERGHHDDQDDG